MSDLKLPLRWDSDNGYIKNNDNTIVGHAGTEEANRIVDCVNAMAGIEDPAEFVRMANLHRDETIRWENTMRELVGEDGFGSVRKAIEKLKRDADRNSQNVDALHAIKEDDRDNLCDMLWWLKGYKKGADDNFENCPFHQDHLDSLDKVVKF